MSDTDRAADARVDRSQALVAELQHRTRNLMAVIQALANETALSSGSIEEFSVSFSARLACLARAQALLSRLDGGERPSIGDLVAGEIVALGAAADGRISIEGPPHLWLRPTAIQPLALALHELGVDAVRNGALSSANGRLSVGWRCVFSDERGRNAVRIDWIERGVGMARTHVGQAGFGRDLVEQALAFQAGADVRYDITQNEVRCVIVLPADDAPE